MVDVPEVSVVIPTKDRWRFLEQSLRSVFEQSGVTLELVVIDDGSVDETAPRLAQLDDDRLRIFRNDTPRGVAGARNLGVQHARAAWIAFLDDDDLWSPEKLERQLAAAKAHNAAFAYAGAAFVDEMLDLAEIVEPPSSDGLLRSLLAANTIPAGASNVIARTELVRRVGAFDEALLQLADWDLWIRLARLATPATCPEPLVAYRMHRANMASLHQDQVIEELERLAAKHSAVAREEGVVVDRVRQTRWIAWAQRREGRRLAAAGLYLRGALRYRSAGNLVRAVGALLGERALTLGRATRPAQSALAKADLSWLDRYR
jgi:glycosyltransferase involved in cell wall biosynthesis